MKCDYLMDFKLANKLLAATAMLTITCNYKKQARAT
jgi:hypothetical protein